MEAWELIVIGVWAFVVSLIGGLVGLVLGNLRLPVVVQFASSPAAGAGANVAISGAAAVASAWAHARGGRVSWRLFACMAPPSLIGAVIGGLVAGELPGDVLLVAIGVVVLYGAWEVARYRRPGAAATGTGSVHLVIAAGVGFGVGLLAGFVGLILGSMRLPACHSMPPRGGPHPAAPAFPSVDRACRQHDVIDESPASEPYTRRARQYPRYRCFTTFIALLSEYHSTVT